MLLLLINNHLLKIENKNRGTANQICEPNKDLCEHFVLRRRESESPLSQHWGRLFGYCVTVANVLLFSIQPLLLLSSLKNIK